MSQGRTIHDVSEGPYVGLYFGKSWQVDGERAYMRDLIEVLLPFPGGLRRWSIMRAIRSRRKRGGEQISLKLEDEVERVFRKFCTGERLPKGNGCSSKDAVFYRPKEKAGEVWAVIPSQARIWLNTQTGAEFDAG